MLIKMGTKSNINTHKFYITLKCNIILVFLLSN